jgi:hypothetical protein
MLHNVISFDQSKSQSQQQNPGERTDIPAFDGRLGKVILQKNMQEDGLCHFWKQSMREEGNKMSLQFSWYILSQKKIPLIDWSHYFLNYNFCHKLFYIRIYPLEYSLLNFTWNKPFCVLILTLYCFWDSFMLIYTAVVFFFFFIFTSVELFHCVTIQCFIYKFYYCLTLGFSNCKSSFRVYT